MPTPTLSTGAQLSPGRFMSPDRDGVTVLDDEGVPLFSGAEIDVQRFMDAHDLIPHCNCELIEAIVESVTSFQ